MWVCRFSVLRKERKLYWNAVVIVTRVWRVWALARGKSIVHSSGNSLGTEIYHQIFVFINGGNQCEDFCRYGGEAMDFQWHKTEIFDNASVWTGPEPGEIKISDSQDLVFKFYSLCRVFIPVAVRSWRQESRGWSALASVPAVYWLCMASHQTGRIHYCFVVSSVLWEELLSSC